MSAQLLPVLTYLRAAVNIPHCCLLPKLIEELEDNKEVEEVKNTKENKEQKGKGKQDNRKGEEEVRAHSLVHFLAHFVTLQ